MTVNTITAPQTAMETFSRCGQDDDEDARSLVRDILERVGDKWTLFVIRSLTDGPMRFTALQSAVDGISHRMLTRTLRALERDGMVSRTVFAEVPPRVEYAITPFGATFIGPVTAILSWAERNRADIEANRRAFDDR